MSDHWFRAEKACATILGRIPLDRADPLKVTFEPNEDGRREVRRRCWEVCRPMIDTMTWAILEDDYE